MRQLFKREDLLDCDEYAVDLDTIGEIRRTSLLCFVNYINTYPFFRPPRRHHRSIHLVGEFSGLLLLATRRLGQTAPVCVESPPEGWKWIAHSSPPTVPANIQKYKYWALLDCIPFLPALQFPHIYSILLDSSIFSYWIVLRIFSTFYIFILYNSLYLL